MAKSRTFTLTNGTDTATANVFTAGLLENSGGSDRINALQSEDNLTGTAGRTDNVLNLTLGNSNDNVGGGTLVTPTLNNIQTLNAVFSNTDGTGLDLQDATGLEVVNVTRVSTAGATIINMPGAAVELSVANSAAYSDVELSYRNSELAGTQNVTLNVSNVLVDELEVGATAIQSQEIETLTLNVASDSLINTIDMRADGLATTAQTLVINATGDLTVGQDIDGDGNYVEENNAFLDYGTDQAIGGAGGAADTAAVGLGAITITGAGNVTLASVGTADDVANNATVDAFTLNGSAATGNIAVNITNSAGDAQSAFTTGTGTDTVLSTVSLSADVTTNAGADTVSITGSLVNTESATGVDTAASISTGDDADTVTVTVSLQNNTAITSGAGNDVVTIGGDVNAAVVGNTDSDVDAVVNAGEGDDTLTFGIASVNTTTAAATLQAAPAIAGDIAGGTGADVMTITAEAAVTANATTLDVTGVETLNLTARFATTDDGVNNNLANSTLNTTADFTVDLARFDADLAAVNIDNQDAVTLVQNAYDADADGDIIAVTLNNVVSEVLSVTSVETTRNATNTGTVVDALGSGAASQAAAIASYDVTLTLNQATNTVATDAQTINLTGDNNFDVSIIDNGADQIENLTLNVTGAGAHAVNLNNDFEGTLTVTGNGTGNLTLINVQADNVETAAYAGNVFVEVTEDGVHTINTGVGNDVVDLLGDTVATTDALNLGNGTDRIIVDTTLGNIATDADEVFNGFVSIEEVELHSGADVMLDDDAELTGVQRIVVDSTSTIAPALSSTIRVGADFDTTLRVDVERAAHAVIDNNGDVDLNVYVAGFNETNVGTGGAVATAQVDFTDAGTGAVRLEISIDDVAQTIGAAAGQDIRITAAAADAEIDTIVLKDTTLTANAGGNRAATGDITLTLAANWAQASDTVTVDASDITNDRSDANNDGDYIDNGDINDTQTTTLNAAAANYKVNITGSQMADAITGGTKADTIDGQAGNDNITGGQGADSLTGGAGTDTFTYAGFADSNSDKADTITDFVSATDKFAITISTVDVDGAGALTNAVVNLSNFATAATAGDGRDTLAGSDTTLGANGVMFVAGDGYYNSGAGTLVIDLDGDGDVTPTNDLYVNVGTVAATDLNFTINATGGAGVDVMRGSQGADTFNADSNADQVVLLGSLTNAQVDAYDVAGNAAAVGITANIDDVLGYSELLSVRSATEVVAGETINANGFNIVVDVFGTADMSLVNLVLGGGTITVNVHSDVTFSQEQLASIATINFIGDTPHNVTIISRATPTTVVTTLTDAEQIAALTDTTTTVQSSGPNTVIQIGANAEETPAEYVATMTTAIADEVGAADDPVVTGTSITADMTESEIEDALAAGTLANVVATNMTAAQLAKVAASIASHADNVAAITGTLAITNDLTATQIGNLFAEYTGTTATAVITGMTDDAKITALDNAKIATGGITGSVTGLEAVDLAALLTKAADIADNSLTGNLSMSTVAAAGQVSLLGKYAGTTATADATGMTLANHNSLIAATAKISSIIDLALADGNVDDAADITALLAKTTTATVNVASMSAAEVTAVAGGVAGIAAGGISNLTVTSTQGSTELAALLGKATNANVTATSMTATQLNSVAAGIAGVGAQAISGDMALTSNVSAANITALTGKYEGSTTSAVVTGMSATQLDALAAAIGTDGTDFAAAGLTGTLALTSANSNTEIDALISKYTGTTVSAVVTGMNGDQLTSLATANANVAASGLTGDLALTSVVSEADMTTLFGKYAGTTGTAVATTMDGAQQAALVGGIAKIQVDGITGTLALTENSTDETDLAALLGTKTAAAATVTVNAAGMSDAEENAVLTGLSKVDTIDNLTLDQTQWAAVVAASAQAALNTALVDGGSLVVTAGATTSAVDATAIAKGVTINVGGNANVLTGGAGDDVFILASGGGFTAAAGLAITGAADGTDDTLRITGTNAVDLDAATTLTTTVEILDLTTDTGVQLLTISDAQRTAFATVNAEADDVITITDLTTTVAGTGAIDKFVFAADDTAIVISSFTSITDKLNVNALTASNSFDADVDSTDAAVAGTITDGQIYFVTSVVAGQADTAAGASAAINASGIWTNATNAQVAYFVVIDDNSTGIFKYTEAGDAEAAEAELVLIATVGSTATGDYLFA